MHYRLVEPIGEGGMGVVWKAVDTTLERQVAIKILPGAFAQDPERLARFEREAKVLASLNHANIATIHGFHSAGGVLFLAMELVEGQDLAQRLAAGPLPLEAALGLASQVADALEAAHDRGVIHRDLKPANVRLTAAGKAKVLDLGLARVFDADPRATVDQRLSLSPTLTSAGTIAGMLLGTAAYMSPEQARGQVADRRSDVWAFGALLYEMLSGRQAFPGSTASDTLASVLKSEPDWAALPADTPASIRRLLQRCLAKDAERRLHHIADARLEIKEALEGADEAPAAAKAAAPAAGAPAWVRLLPWALSVVLAVVAAVALRQGGEPGSAATASPLYLALPFPEGVELLDDQWGSLALAPDGSSLAFVGVRAGEQSLFLKKLSGDDVTELRGTANATTPFFSPDGQWIGFFAENKLKKISVEGGKPVTLCAAPSSNRGASWGAGDRIVLAQHYTHALTQVSGGGGEPTALTTLDKGRNERTHRWPQFVQGTDVVLFTVQTTDSPEFYDDARIDALRLATGERRTVLEGASLAKYAPSGHLLFAREGFLFAVPFDAEKLEATGAPVPVVENVMGSRNSGIVHAAVAANGLLAYVEGTSRSRQAFMTWRGRDGSSERLPLPPNNYQNPAVSPDGRRIAVAIAGESNFDIWTYDLERETLTRLTFEGNNQFPVWSPDSRSIAFFSIRDTAPGSTFLKAADGSGATELLYSAGDRPDGGIALPHDWSADGKFLAIGATDQNGPNIVVLPLDGDREPRAFLESPSGEFMSAFSPDGRFIAYASDESGRNEIYVRPFGEAGGRWQISIDGGVEPYWTSDGREIFFRFGRKLLVAEIDTREGFRAGRPRVLLEDLPLFGQDRGYSIAPDGQRVIFAEAAEQGVSPREVTVVVSWLDELRRRVPP